MNEIDKRKAYSARRTVWLRNYQRARSRALTKLAQQYPDQYKELLEQERLSDVAEGKAWSDLSDGIMSTVGSASTPDRGSEVPVQHTNTDQQN